MQAGSDIFTDSRRKRRKGNTVPGGIWPPRSLGDKNKGTWPSRLWSLESETVKYIFMSAVELEPESDCAGEAQQ
jgi:hypothetical protein